MGIPDNELEQITNQYLDETEENLEVELAEFQSEGWTINDKEMAMKIDYVIHKMEEKIAEDEAIAKAQKDVLQVKIDKLIEGQTRLDEWLERSTKSYRNNISDLKTHLHLFHQRTMDAEEAENKKRIVEGKKPLKVSKSIKLTYRDLTSKVQSPEIIKEDDQLLNWVKNNHSLTVPYSELNEFLAEKEAKDEYSITIDELLTFVNNINSKFIKLEPALAWGEFKKTLNIEVVDIKEIDEEGNEIVIGTRLVYFDEDGQEVPHIKLIPQGIKFSEKLVDFGE